MNRYPVPAGQRGIALAVGLIFLVIVTIMGLAAVRVTSSQTLQAANYQFKTVTFQGAESAIRRVMDEVRDDDATDDVVVFPRAEGVPNILVAAARAQNLAAVPTRAVNVIPPYLSATAGAVTSNAIVTADNPDGNGPALDNYSITKYSTYRFTIRATSTVLNTSATSVHQQGLARVTRK